MAIVKRLVKGQALTPEEHDANLTELDEKPNGQVYPKTSGVGIKIDHEEPDWGWCDLAGVLHTDFSSPETLPIFTSYIGNLKARQFDVGDEAFLEIHIPHDYAPNTHLYIHVHWSHNSLTVESGAPTFIVEGTYAKGHNQSAFGTPVSVTLTDPASTTRYQHMVTESQLSNYGGTGGLLDTNNIEVDGVLLLRVFLAGNTINDGSLPFVHFVDIHHQSTGINTKNKAPSFYA